MIDIKQKKDCTGCEACANICPKGCIRMISDNEGFFYPQIDHSKCIECGLCKKACPIINPLPLSMEYEHRHAYAAINRNEHERLSSSSGGIFPLLTHYVFSRNGVVYGAAFDEYYNVKHLCADNETTAKKLYTSKYVQSNIGDCFKQIKEYLEADRWVLFSGTPCQVNGLKTFLGKEYDKLINVDFICHGVPSPGVWRRYLDEIIDNSKKIGSINFRNKKYGWSDFYFSLDYQSGEGSIYEAADRNGYVKGFLQNLFLRPSCHACKFKTINRVSDITIADFWGIGHILPELYDDKGCSLVIVNSIKGVEVFNEMKNGIIYKSVEFSKAVAHNKAMIISSTPHPERCEFFERYKNENICVLTNEMCKIPTVRRMKKIIKKFIIRLKSCKKMDFRQKGGTINDT